ncbi:MAG: hypothetical protein IJV83_00045 [Clostridia bacterium]|nr:hypothetical protein [Clostridia bacterium]
MSKNSFGKLVGTVLASAVGTAVCFYAIQHLKKDECEHVWDNGEVTLEATCTNEGELTYTCEECGETKTEEIIATGHTNKGGFCTVCGEADITYSVGTNYLAREISTGTAAAGKVFRFYKTGHDMDGDTSNGYECWTTGNELSSLVLTSTTYSDMKICIGDSAWGELKEDTLEIALAEAGGAPLEILTVEELGFSTYKGETADGTIYVDLYVEKNRTLAMEYDGVVYTIRTNTLSVSSVATEVKHLETHEHTPTTVAGVAPKCTALGYTEWTKCSVCGVAIIEKQAIAATGHTVVTDPAVAATCKTAGKTAGKHCAVCGTVITVQEIIPATGTHRDGNADGNCDACGVQIIDFSFYQDTANYTTQPYTEVTAFNGAVARLNVATTAADGTVTDNLFMEIEGGTKSFTYNRETDSFDYRYDYYESGQVEEGRGTLTHTDMQYYAFTVDGEWYVDVFFDNETEITLYGGTGTFSEGDPKPYFGTFVLGNLQFTESTNVQILKKNSLA